MDRPYVASPGDQLMVYEEGGQVLLRGKASRIRATIMDSSRVRVFGRPQDLPQPEIQDSDTERPEAVAGFIADEGQPVPELRFNFDGKILPAKSLVGLEIMILSTPSRKTKES